MAKRWLPFVTLFCTLAVAQQQANTTSDTAPSGTSVATVTALTRGPLDSKSCVLEREFRSSITSPFIFNGFMIEEGAEFVGHIQACNRDESGKLQAAVVVMESVAMPKRTMPILAFLQALGPPLRPLGITQASTQAVSRDPLSYHAVSAAAEINDPARPAAANTGILDRTAIGEVDVTHVRFANTEAENSLLWVFVADGDSVAIPGGSQLVVRFSISPSANRP